MHNWIAFIKERFNPAQYIPMIFAFVLANGLYISKAENLDWSPWRFALVFFMILSFFFRMRLFDEIKDYEVDLKINPTRPLARGILKIPQVKTAIFILLLFELVTAAYLGMWPFIVHTLAIAYSLLMYEEFFIGDFLRPHLTTYAISHTFVSILLGISSAVALNDFDPTDIHAYHLTFFAMNWAIFNLFEFARKTFAKNEEKKDSPSYSSLFGPRRAYVLSITEAVLAVLLIQTALKNPLMIAYQTPLFSIFFMIYVLITCGYFFKPTEKSAKIFRAVTGVYLLINYSIIIYIFGVL